MFLLSLFIAGNLRSQHPYFQKLTAQQGLPTSTIYDLFTSDQGLLYLGLETGLARFNGIKFTVFPVVENRSRSVNAIQQSFDGTIWCMNFTNQIFFLDKDTLRPHKEINSIIQQSGPLRDFIVHEKGIYFLTDKELFLYPNKGKFKSILKSETSQPNNNFVEVLSCKDGKGIHVIDNLYVYELNIKHELINKIALVKGQNTAVIYDSMLVTVPKSKIINLKIDGQSPKFNNDVIGTYINKVVSIDQDLWLCTNTGLIPYKRNKNSFEAVFFQNTRITDIAKDFEGGYWISSVDRGLFYMPSIEINFVTVSDYNIYSISEGPNQSFFAGTGNGDLFHFTKKGDLIKQLKTNYVSEVEFIFFEPEKNRTITSHGVFDLNQSYQYKPVRLGKNIIKDNYGNYLINTYNQAILINQDLKNPPNIFNSQKHTIFENYSQFEIPFFPLYKNRSNCAFFDSLLNVFYLGTYEALYKINQDLRKEVITLNNRNITPLHITPFKNNEYIIATQKNGVLKLRGDTLSTLFHTGNGLSSDACRKTILKDEFLLVLTDLGLDLIDLQKNNISNLSSSLSLKNLNIFDLTLIEDQIYLATDIGIIFFKIPTEGPVLFPKLHNLTLVSTVDERLISDEVLEYNKNDVRFVADAIHFKNLGQYEFSYRLLGYDTTWQLQQSKNNIFNYMALSPGDYTFELRTVVNGVFSQTYTKSFSISRPFWQSPWFYILLFLMVIAFSYLIFRRLLKQQRQKQLIKQRLLQSQLTSLRAQMNPHFMFNIVNSVQGLIYANKRAEASNLLGKMSTLLRRALEVSDKAKISIQEELEILNNYVELEAARFESGFEYEIKSNISKEERHLKIPSLIVQPFVENAIKHGLMHKEGIKKLRIEINKDAAENIIIIIQDNGIGRAASERINAKRINHQPFASEAIDSRISLINQANDDLYIELEIEDLHNTNNHPSGTKITIKINKDE